MIGNIKKILKPMVRGIFDFGISEYEKKMERRLSDISCQLSQMEQKRLFLSYKQMLAEQRLPSIKDVGFRVFSQTDEDGILLYLFSLIGTTNKICVDLAFESPFGANTSNLICNWGWSGFLICASDENVTFSKKFFLSNPDTKISPPLILKKWITAENINDILFENGLCGEIDLFSLDIDGVDYWIWKKLDVIRPRVMIVEFLNIWGNERSVTVPYRSDFNRHKGPHMDFYGASLAAFVGLANEKGYRLVACNNHGFNAVFIKNELGLELIPTLSVKECLRLSSQPPWVEEKRKQQLAEIKNLNWIDV